MNWIVLAGEIYHCSCPAAEKHWTLASDPAGACAGCGERIPEDVVRLAEQAPEKPQAR